MSSALICSNFLSASDKAGYVSEAFPHVQWLSGIYESLSITNTTFLHVRGMPFLSVFLDRSLPIVQASMPREKVIKWYASMQTHLDADGAASVQAFASRLDRADKPLLH